MENSVQGIQPSSLSAEELLKYAFDRVQTMNPEDRKWFTLVLQTSARAFDAAPVSAPIQDTAQRSLF